MRIGIDLTGLWRPRTGLLVYALNLTQALLKIDDRNEYTLFFTERVDSDLIDLGSFDARICRIRNEALNKQFWFPASKLSVSVDVMHFPTFPSPAFWVGPMIITIPDATAWLYSRTVTSLAGFYYRFFYRVGASRSNRILAYSESARQDISRVLKVDSDKIVVTPLSSSYSLSSVDDAQSRLVKARYALPEHYVLAVSTIEPRKNTEGLLKAFKLLKVEHSYAGKLVMVGRIGWHAQQFWQTLQELDLEADVALLGYVPREDLPAIYALADVFAYPSFYEGFGLPILDAMACGCPVVTSDRSSMPEVAGNAAILVDPSQPGQIARALNQACSDPPTRNRLVLLGKQRVAEFSWERTASQTLEVYTAVFHETHRR